MTYGTRIRARGRGGPKNSDRDGSPVSFWEATNQPRVSAYPFTVIQMQIGRDGKGRGTMSYATRITAKGNVIELEALGHVARDVG